VSRFSVAALIGVCLALGGAGWSAAADAAGTWSAGPSMNAGRWQHTAHLLSDGRVIVVGGETGSTPLATTELYDPASNSWSAGPSMQTARIQHSATLLQSGKLLVVGGLGPGPSLTGSAELFDPKTTSWSSAGSISPRRGHAAALLPDGRVLVSGGNPYATDTGAENLADTTIFDPDRNSWTLSAAMIKPRAGHIMVTLRTGRLLVAGGWSRSGALNETEIYDFAKNMWAVAAPMVMARVNAAGVVLNDGRVLVAGGCGGCPFAELYDPTTNAWTTPTQPQTNPGYPRLTMLADGRAVMTGGSGPPPDFNGVGGFTPLAIAEIYDPAAGTWTRTVGPGAPRQANSATLLSDGRVLVAGGSADNNPAVENASTLFFDPGRPETGSGTANAIGPSPSPEAQASLGSGSSPENAASGIPTTAHASTPVAGRVPILYWLIPIIIALLLIAGIGAFVVPRLVSRRRRS